MTVTAAPAAGLAVERVTPYLLGSARGVTLFEGDDATPVPELLVALTVNVYAVPAVSPVTVHDSAVAGDGVQVRLPGDEVTV